MSARSRTASFARTRPCAGISALQPIRHHNKEQKTGYDESIWLSWAFYYYLATINACVRLIERSKQ